MSDPSTFLAHIVSQTRSNIDFLVSQNQISQADATEIISKLPPTNDSAMANLTQQTQRLALASVPNVSPSPSPNPVAPARRGIPPPPRRTLQVRALWSWNEDGQDPNDLHFKAGDVFEIITETNADWWKGRHNGREGLFPSNYVEKLDTSSSPPRANENTFAQDQNYPASHVSQYQHHHPPMGPPPFIGQPSGFLPPNQQVAYTGGPYSAQPPGNVAAQAEPEQPQKSAKFGGMKNTLAHAAVGGVGFGAGSAVGSGIINSIF